MKELTSGNSLSHSALAKHDQLFKPLMSSQLGKMEIHIGGNNHAVRCPSSSPPCPVSEVDKQSLTVLTGWKSQVVSTLDSVQSIFGLFFIIIIQICFKVEYPCHKIMDIYLFIYLFIGNTGGSRLSHRLRKCSTIDLHSQPHLKLILRQGLPMLPRQSQIGDTPASTF